jgi:hypothetical protein
MKIKELLKKFLSWQSEAVVDNRVANNETGYGWVSKGIGYDKDLNVVGYQEFFDRQDLNDEYAQRYEEQDIRSKKPYVYHQNEINLIYSFHKCFAMRNHSRLQYYKNDLIQKGARTKSAINIGLGKLEQRKEKVEKD